MFTSISRSVALSALIIGSAASAGADELPAEVVSPEATPVEVIFVSAAAPEAELETEANFRQEVAAMVESDLMSDLLARLAEQSPAS